MTTDDPPAPTTWRLSCTIRRVRQHRGDALAVTWLVVLAALYLSPALKDGWNFGPADVGRALSLLTQVSPHLPPHNSISGDTITQGVPWNTLDWRLVRSGQLPLWNSFSGTGLPQLFNFESAPFSLATVVGYLAPLSMSFLVTVAAKLLIAGTGAYVACRVLGAGPLSAAFGGTTFMLSGSFAGWLGWSVGGPIAFGGWILAATVIAYRSRHEMRQVLLLAGAVAFSLYAGFPESYLLLGIGLGVTLVVTGVATLLTQRCIDLAGAVRIGVGVVAGAALAAPLWLPGLSVLSGSARRREVAAPGIPAHFASLIFAQGFYGLPINGSTWFGSVNYYETASYVGVIAIVLALVGAWHARRRPVVIGLVTSTIVALLIIYRIGAANPLQRLLDDLGLATVALQRMQAVMELGIALLAGLGLETVLRRGREAAVRRSFFVSSSAVAVTLAILWTRVGAARLPATTSTAKGAVSVATLESLRRSSLIWPTATIGLLLISVVVGWLLRHSARQPRARALHVGAVLLLALQGAFLLFAGVGINSYARVAYQVTPAVATIQNIVGTNLLGLDSGNSNCDARAPRSGSFCGVRLWRDVGLYPEMNIVYGIDELALHDPTIPQSYFDGWPVADADPSESLNLFAPDIDTVALAHRYGVAFVLAGPGIAAPPGMRLVANIAGEDLYKVPGTSQFSFSDRDSGARVMTAEHPNNASYDLRVDAPNAATLAIAITDSPGWHASIDGRGVALHRTAGDLLQLEVPAGSHDVVLSYWPRRFSEGLFLAAVALVLFVSWPVVRRLKATRGRAVGPPTSPD
jgi:hypothetical protein